MLQQSLRAAFILGAACFLPMQLWAASCCGGGGSASALVLAKNSSLMTGFSLSHEVYDGFWGKNGIWVPDPQGSSLSQTRLNMGLAKRLNDHWQLVFALPYVWNKSAYSQSNDQTQGIGDSAIALTYEAFDSVTCLYNIETWEDLKPAIYFGSSLTLPTGISPYDDVENNFDITGRGFYRLDVSALFEKSIYPWSATLALHYGYHFKRPVNREYGVFVQPYDKQLGNRSSANTSLAYTWFLSGQSVTLSGSLRYLREEQSVIDGIVDTTSGITKKDFGSSLSWANSDSSWVVNLGFNQAPPYDNWGENFPSTQTFSLGINHVFE